jgi:hypothetical protein
LVLGVAMIAAAAPALADVLVLTNGRRLQGELIGVFGREIEFEERDGPRRRIVRIPREDIDRIEFEGRRVFDADDRGPGPVSIPRGMRERRVNVNSREPWTDAGIEVREGQALFFLSSGEVRWGPNRRDGAAGERDSPVNNARPLPDRPAAALIGRIGDRQDVFFIGADPGPYRARASGRLYLGINDDWLADNSGSFRVIVSY